MKNGLDDPFRFCPRCSRALTIFHDGERLRLHCEYCNWIHYRNPTVGVAVILLTDEGLWLGKRRSGGWCIPCGHVEWDEDIESAARREMLEETGLAVTLKDVFTVHSNFHNPDQHTVGVWFLGETDDLSGARPGGDLVDLKAFPLSNLPSLIFPTDQKVVDQIKIQFPNS
jgi:8-oxo-dGTP diphosphatase